MAQIWMDISDIGKEAFIHWNGPPAARVDSLGETEGLGLGDGTLLRWQTRQTAL